MQDRAKLKLNILKVCIVFAILLLFFACGVTLSGGLAYSATPLWEVENGTILSYNGSEEIVIVPQTYNGETITKIGGGAFKDNKTVREIEIHDGVVEIGTRAFENCQKLRKVTLGNNVTAISDYTFLQCERLESLFLPSTVKSIGTWAFGYCEKLSDINFPEGLKMIGSATFYGCSALKEVILPDSLTSFGTHCFRGCMALASLSLSNNLQTIPFRAFSGCTALREINIPSSVSSIDGEAFYQSSITSVKMLDGVKEIGDMAFFECANLTDINLPQTISVMGEGVFWGCENIREIVLPNEVETIGSNAFNGCYRLRSIRLGEKLKEIKEGAFDGCLKLIEIFNPSSLNLALGSADNGGVGLNAKVIHTNPLEKSFIEKVSDAFVFYNDNVNRPLLIDYTDGLGEIALPEDINGKEYDIGKYAFYKRTEIYKVSLPACIKRIEEKAFHKGMSVVEIIYDGTEEQWQNVQVDEGNDCLHIIRFRKVDENGGLNGPSVQKITFKDELLKALKGFIEFIVTNIFIVNFILILVWGILLIYGGAENEEQKQNQKKVFVIIACVQWILISGLRADSVGADTENYMNFFDFHSKLSWGEVFASIKNYFLTGQADTNMYLDTEPLFIVFNKFVSTITTNHVAYKFIIAIIFMSALGRYVYKYSEDPCLSFAIYGSLFYNMFSLTGYRQVLAVAIILFAFRFIRERKLVPFLIALIFGFLMHKTTLIFILLYILANKKITMPYIMLILSVFFVMIIFNRQVFELVRGIVGYDEYVGNYGFRQYMFTIFYVCVTAVSFWKFKEVTEKDPQAVQYYNGLILSWLMFPFIIQSPSSLRLVYNFGFVLLLLLPKVINAFTEKKDRAFIYLIIYIVLGVQATLSSFEYSFFW